MPQDDRKTNEPSLTSLITGIVGDVQDLLEKQFTLLKTEAKQELKAARNSAIGLGTGSIIAGVGVLFLLLMAAHALYEYHVLPLWGAYGVIGGILALIGGGLLAYGAREAADVELPPPQTTQALKENLQLAPGEPMPGDKVGSPGR